MGPIIVYCYVHGRMGLWKYLGSHGKVMEFNFKFSVWTLGRGLTEYSSWYFWGIAFLLDNETFSAVYDTNSSSVNAFILHIHDIHTKIIYLFFRCPMNFTGVTQEPVWTALSIWRLSGLLWSSHTVAIKKCATQCLLVWTPVLTMTQVNHATWQQLMTTVLAEHYWLLLVSQTRSSLFQFWSD